MSPWEANTEGRGAAAAWEVCFWLLFVIDLCVMQYLAAIALMTPFAIGIGGFFVFKAWIWILLFEGIYVTGLIHACRVRKRQPIAMVALLVATPFVSYGGWYVVTRAGWVPPVLGPILS